MTSTTVAVSQTQSLAAIRNFIRASVSCITYARGLCNDSAFESKPFLGFELKHMVPKTLEAKTLSEWIEKGAFDALNRGFLKEMSLCVYNPDCSELLESYCFSFVYNDDKQRATLGLSSEQFILPDRKTSFIIPCKDERELCEKIAARSCNNLLTQSQMSQVSGQFSRRSKEEVQKILAILLSRLLEVVESLPPLLTERVLTMRLTYYDEVVPASYEPPCFAPATNHMVLMYKDELTHNVQLGVANTGHHIFTISVRHPLLASIHNRLKRKRHPTNKSGCTEVCNYKHIDSKQNQTESSCSSYNTRSTDVPSYNALTNSDKMQSNKNKLAAALAKTNEDKTGAALMTTDPGNVNRNITKQTSKLTGDTVEENLQKHTHGQNELNSLLEHDCCVKSAMFDCDWECNSNEVLELVNIPTLRELMICSLQEKVNQCNHLAQEVYKKPVLLESPTQQSSSSSSLSSEPSHKLRLIDIAYLLLVCFAFTKSPAATHGRGSFTSKDLDEYLNHSCPLGLSSSQGLHLMDKLVEEQYLTKTFSSSSVQKRTCTNLEDIHNVINDTSSKKRRQKYISSNNFGKINKANCNFNCKQSSQIKGEGTISNVMMFEKNSVLSNATTVVEWKFLSDPPYDVVEWLLSQHRVMELLSPSHYEILTELAQTLKKKK